MRLALENELAPMKLNYEIHGNSVPHLHLHLSPTQRGDRFAGRPIDSRELSARTNDEFAAIERALDGLDRTDSYGT